MFVSLLIHDINALFGLTPLPHVKTSDDVIMSTGALIIILAVMPSIIQQMLAVVK